MPALLALSLLLAQQPDPRVDSLFAFVRDTTPGCAVAAMRNGTTLYSRGYGLADLEHGVPITPQTPFYLASVSKQFTAAAIGLLMLDGKLGLEDDVRKWVPEFPQYGTPITIRHLLLHTSGLRDYLSLFGLAGLGDFPITNADFLASMGRQRALNFPTGSQYSYSNSGYVLLSIIVERVSGKSIRAFAEERIFQPLGMTSTLFRDRIQTLIKGRALAYRRTANGYVTSMPSFDVVGDGGLFSSVADLARWEGNFWNARVGGAGLSTWLDTRGRLDHGAPSSYGFGLAHSTYRGDPMVEHGGGYGGYNTYLLRLPRRRFSVAVLCNGVPANAGNLARGVVDVFLGDSLEKVVAQAPGSAAGGAATDTVGLGRLVGTYYADQVVLVRRIMLQNGKLYYRRAPDNQSELVRVEPRRFALTGSEFFVRFSARADSLILEGSGDRPVAFQRVAPGAGDGRAYAGSYTSSDLRDTWIVVADSARLTVRGERGGPYRVSPVFEDAFEGDGLLVRFLRNPRRQINGMEVSNGERARKIRFDRP